MRKIPTIFVRDFDNNPKHVTKEPNPECPWVFAGEGIATRKYDGTCVMRDECGDWWARREVKEGKTPPPGFVALDTDNETGKTVGWEPVDQSGFAKWLHDAVDTRHDSGPYEWPTGTYELCGPKINGNPERYTEHVLAFHGSVELADAPRDFDGLAAWLHSHPYEGIVWHHPDGRMAKIKTRDFPRPQDLP